MNLSYEQKRAFHDKTAETLGKTQYSDIVNVLQISLQNGKMDQDTFNYCIVALFSIATQVRAATLGMDVESIRYTPEESERNKRNLERPNNNT